MKILGTEEYRTFRTEDGERDAKVLIADLEKTASYIEVKKSSIMAGEIVDCPIIQQCHETAPVPVITTKPGVAFPGLDKVTSFTMSKDIDQQVVEAMSETRMALGMPFADEYEKTFEPVPLASNALAPLVAQAIVGKSSLLCRTEEKSSGKPMRATTRAAIINECLSLQNDTCKVYICDGMVRYVAGSNYTYLPISELMTALEDTLKEDFPSYTFSEGQVSHQYLQFTYLFNNAFLDKRLEEVLSEAGITKQYRLGLVFTTSNTGVSGANLYPVLFGKGQEVLMIEEPLKLEHEGAASIEAFKEKSRKIMSLLKSTPERLEELADTPIKHDVEAYKNAAAKAGLPVTCYADQAELFAATYGCMATMLDLYMELSCALQAYAEKNGMDPLRKMKFMSSLSRVFLDKENFKEIDTDVDYSASRKKAA